VWTSLVKATASGSALKKSGGCSTCFDAGAISQQVLTGDGSLSFTIAAGQRLFAGLGQDTTSSTGYATIDYAFSFWESGTWEIRERNTYRADGAVAAGDVFKVDVTAGVVRYYRNATLVYTSRTPNTAPLVADTSLSTLAAAVTSATMLPR
jgi:hypothetical protein